MTKKSKKRRIHQSSKPTSLEDRIDRALSHLRHRDLQMECVRRGMPFDEIVGKSHHHLVSFFYENFETLLDEQKVVEFNAWVEEQLKTLGYKDGDIMLSPSFRLGYTKGIENLDKIKNIKPIGNEEVPKNVKKAKSEVDIVTGIRKGTKKHLSYDLAARGTPIAEIIAKVKEVFPDAQEKSIKIWAKRSLDQMRENK